MASRRNPADPIALAWQQLQGGPMLKFIGGTVGVIFLIGLLVVIGVLSLIF